MPWDALCQISHCWVYPLPPIPRSEKNISILWPKHGPHMDLQIGSSWISIIVPRNFPWQSSHCWVSPVAPFPRNGQNMALLWPEDGPSNFFFLNLNHCEQGCSKPNFTLLGLSCSPLSWKCPKYGPLWPKHCPSNLLFLNLNQCVQEWFMPNFRVLASTLRYIFNFLTHSLTR